MSHQAGLPEGLCIRPETAGDVAAIGAINRAAFGTDVEADLVDALRLGGHLVLSLVAEMNGVPVGAVAFPRLRIEAGAAAHDAIGLAPFAVLAAHQRQGIGAALVRDGLRRLGGAGERLCFVVGDPSYYGRFGFSAGRGSAFDCAYAGPYFMALDLGAGSAPATGGQVTYPPPFADLE